jgi:hypothetical protein
MLENPKTNIRIKLSLLWATIMSLYIYADYFNLMTPGSLEAMMNLETPLGRTSPNILIGFSVLLIIPALMIPASILLRPTWGKWINIVFGIVYSLISALIIISDFTHEWMKFFILYQVVELFIFVIIIRSAWAWPTKSI